MERGHIDLEHRVARLEEANQRLKWGLLVLCLTVGLTVLMGQGEHGTQGVEGDVWDQVQETIEEDANQDTDGAEKTLKDMLFSMYEDEQSREVLRERLAELTFWQLKAEVAAASRTSKDDIVDVVRARGLEIVGPYDTPMITLGIERNQHDDAQAQILLSSPFDPNHHNVLISNDPLLGGAFVLTDGKELPYLLAMGHATGGGSTVYMSLDGTVQVSGHGIKVGGPLSDDSDEKREVVITAKAVSIGKNGTCVSEWGADENGGTLWIRNNDHKVTGILRTNEYGGALAVYDSNEIVAGALATDENGGKVMVVSDKTGIPAAIITASEEGGDLAVYNKEGNQVATLDVFEDDGRLLVAQSDGKTTGFLGTSEYGGFIMLNNEDAKPFVTIGASENGGEAGIFNKTEEVVVTARVDEYGNGEVGAWDRKGKGRTLTPGP